MTDLELKQLEREQICKQRAEKRYTDDNKKKEDLVNGSNTDFAHEMKRELLGLMIKEMSDTINKERTVRTGHQVPIKFQILDSCLGIQFRRYKPDAKGLEGIDKQSIFSPELACHIALQLALDAALLPNRPPNGKSSTNKWREAKPTIRMIQDKIAEELWRQLHYKVVSENFPRWWSRKLKEASADEGSKSSAHYAHSDLDKSIGEFRDYWAKQGHSENVKYLEFREWSYEERQVIGSWLFSLTYQTQLFKQVKSLAYTGESTIELTPGAEAIRQQIIDQIKEYVFEPLPMIVKPLRMTKQTLGGWIYDGAVANRDIQTGRKGWIELSDKHVDFYNHQQDVSFRINQYIWFIVQELKSRNDQLGKWKFYEYEDPMHVWQRLGIPGYVWHHATPDEQDKLLRADRKKFNAEKRSRSKDIAKNQTKRDEGLTSERLFRIVEQCLEDDFYIPIQPDFRSRYTCRTSFLSYQSTDTGRALLEFAQPHQIDPDDTDAKTHLAIHLANCVGLDKTSNAERIQWVESNLDTIKLVATMDNELNWDAGLKILRQYEKDDPFQLAAACREYYELYIIHSRNYTHLPISVDATCSGQQLIAGFLQDGELAKRVNVLPTTKPGDIYRDCMDRTLELMTDDNDLKIRRTILKQLKGSIGRKASKKGFMSGQYGSGKDRQLADIFGYLDDETDIDLNDDERKLLSKYWTKALEDVCKIRTVFNWFSDLVQEIYDNGGKEVMMPTPTGSTIHQLYPIPTHDVVSTFCFGSSQYKESRTNVERPTDKRNLGKWKTATAANCIHGVGDASLLCLALGSFEHSFYAVHDSISTYIGSPMNDLQKRLRQAYVDVVSFDLWNEIRAANGLPTGAAYKPTLSGTLDLDLVKNSKYLFC